jgi:hypothetical protein
MIGAFSQRLALVTRDLVTLSPVSYFVLVQTGQIQLIRASGRTQFDVLLDHKIAGHERDELTNFFSKMKSSPYYCGQPIGILLDNLQCFSFAKRYNGIQATTVRRILATLQREYAELRYILLKSNTETMFLAEGLDKEYLASLIRNVQVHGLRTAFITTLASYVTVTSRMMHGRTPSLSVIQLGHAPSSYLACDSEGNVVYGRTNAEETDVASQIEGFRRGVFGVDLPLKQILYTYSKSNQDYGITRRNAAALFRRGLSLDGQSKKLVIKPAGYRTATIMNTVANSLKLLLIVLSSAAILSGLVAGVTTALSGRPGATVSEYQLGYSRRLLLQQRLDSLQLAASHMASGRINAVSSAAAISLFCQEVPSGLFLNTLAIRYPGTDSMALEASGNARRESLVFRYNRILNDMARQHVVTLTSLRPEIVNSHGVPDTLLNFKFAMNIHEIVDRQ